MSIRSCAALLCGLALLGCSHAASEVTSGAEARSTGTMHESEAAVRAAIEAQHEAWRAAITQGDATAVARLFTDDAVLLAPDGTLAKTRPAVETKLRQILSQTKYLSGGFTVESLDVEGDQAIEVAGFAWVRKMGDAAPTPLQKGHALGVWKRGADGTWRIRAFSPKYDPEKKP
jgi:uncharacterized protein (TIGR02246 family)